MELVIILIRQLIVMVLYMAVGYFLFKRNFVTMQGCKEFGNLLLYIILPCAIINSYRVECTQEKAIALVQSIFISLLALILAMLVCTFLFRKKKIERFGVSFSNAGFIGIPLVSCALGQDAVFYISSFVALLNIFQWTYGVAVMTNSRESIRLQKLVKNPILIAMLIGLLLFAFQPTLPEVLTTSIATLASLNAPMAMIILGIYLAQVDFHSIFTAKVLYFSSAIRLILIPILTMFLLLPLPVDSSMKLAILVAASAPIGSNVAIFAQIYQQDYTLAVREVCLSTIFSVCTIPLIIALYSLIA